MSTGSTQSQAILELLQKDSIIPDVLPAAPNLQGELIIAYPTHTISYVVFLILFRLIVELMAAYSPGEYVQRDITKDTPVVRFKPFQGSSLDPSSGKYSMYASSA